MLNNKLAVYWYGYGGSSWMAEKLRCLIEDELGMKLVTIHEHPNADINWEINSVYSNLADADIVILPANYVRQPCKSNNRLTQAMALKKPIICEPMPSYLPIVKNYNNAILLKKGSEDEWRVALTELRDNKDLRLKLSEEAFKTSNNFSLEKVGNKWVNTLIHLSSIGSRKETIDVVIPTKNNIEILDECLKSFENSSLEEEIYIIENGDGVEELLKKTNIPYEVREV